MWPLLLRDDRPVSIVCLRVFLFLAGVVGIQVLVLPGILKRVYEPFNTTLPEGTLWVMSWWFKAGFVAFVAAAVGKEYLVRDERARLVANVALLAALAALQVIMVLWLFAPLMHMPRLSA